MKRGLKRVVIYKPVQGGRAHHEAALEAVAEGIVEMIVGGKQGAIGGREPAHRCERGPARTKDQTHGP